MSKLTKKLLDETFDQIRNMPPHPCSLGKHVVSAAALREGWKYARCGNCGTVVTLSHGDGPQTVDSEVSPSSVPPDRKGSR